ncbi:MAG TPA: hypothetical protein DDW52_25220 [Planctomycetaceae bacterium]|nr:hypothetical protein [Planctomycetaceae bacterium]
MFRLALCQSMGILLLLFGSRTIAQEQRLASDFSSFQSEPKIMGQLQNCLTEFVQLRQDLPPKHACYARGRSWTGNGDWGARSREHIVLAAHDERASAESQRLPHLYLAFAWWITESFGEEDPPALNLVAWDQFLRVKLDTHIRLGTEYRFTHTHTVVRDSSESPGGRKPNANLDFYDAPLTDYDSIYHLDVRPSFVSRMINEAELILARRTSDSLQGIWQSKLNSSAFGIISFDVDTGLPIQIEWRMFEGSQDKDVMSKIEASRTYSVVETAWQKVSARKQKFAVPFKLRTCYVSNRADGSSMELEYRISWVFGDEIRQAFPQTPEEKFWTANGLKFFKHDPSLSYSEYAEELDKKIRIVAGS